MLTYRYIDEIHVQMLFFQKIWITEAIIIFFSLNFWDLKSTRSKWHFGK
jgi:hypothetical protein